MIERVGSFAVVDLRFDLWCDDAPLAEFLAFVLAPFESAPDRSMDRYDIAGVTNGRPGRCVVQLNDEPVLWPTSRDHAARAFAWHLNARVMSSTTSAVAVHAGAVGRNGQVVLLPGHADAGKSTLVAALVAEGFSYYSDEAALIEPETGRVRPYPRPLSLDDNSMRLLRVSVTRAAWLTGGWLITPEDLGGHRATAAGDVAVIALPQRNGDDESPRSLRRAAAVRALADRAPNIGLVGAPGFRGLVACAKRSKPVVLPVRSLRAALDHIRSLLGVID